MEAVPQTSLLGPLFPNAWLEDRDCVIGSSGQRPSFRRVVEGGDENRDRAYKVQFRRPAGGVFLDADLPDCLPYYTRPGSLRLPRDRCAAALADAVSAVADTLDIPVMLIGGWVVVAAADDGSTDGEACIACAAAVADRLQARLPELREATSATPPPTPATEGLAAALEPSRWWPLPRPREQYLVPVRRADLPPGAEAVRVHIRESLGPEVAARLCVGWQAPVNASAYWAYQGPFEPYRPLDGRSAVPHVLLSDRQVVLRRLAAVIGPDHLDVVDVVSSVGVFNGKDRATRYPLDGAGTWTVVAGADTVSAEEDSRLVAASRRLSGAGPHVFDSAGRWFLMGHDLGVGVLTAESLAGANEGPGDPTHVESEITLKSDGRSRHFLSLAWATRSTRGGELFVEVSSGPSRVTVTTGGDQVFAEHLPPLLGERAAKLAPSRWIVTPDLVVAVGTRHLQLGRGQSSSTGPTARDLGSVLQHVDVDSRWRTQAP